VLTPQSIYHSFQGGKLWHHHHVYYDWLQSLRHTLRHAILDRFFSFMGS
jgi:hypothetical protein